MLPPGFERGFWSLEGPRMNGCDFFSEGARKRPPPGEDGGEACGISRGPSRGEESALAWPRPAHGGSGPDQEPRRWRVWELRQHFCELQHCRERSDCADGLSLKTSPFGGCFCFCWFLFVCFTKLCSNVVFFGLEMHLFLSTECYTCSSFSADLLKLCLPRLPCFSVPSATATVTHLGATLYSPPDVAAGLWFCCSEYSARRAYCFCK